MSLAASFVLVLTVTHGGGMATVPGYRSHEACEQAGRVWQGRVAEKHTVTANFTCTQGPKIEINDTEEHTDGPAD